MKRWIPLGAAAALVLPAAANAQESAPEAPAAPPGLQFLYGSGEAAAMSLQIYRSLEAYALAAAASRPERGVILTDDATLAEPAFVPCGDKPLAAVFDVDETVVLNSGLMHARATGAGDAPAESLAVRAVPGALEAIAALQRAGITPVYNTNRTVDMTDLVIGYLTGLGFAAPAFEETLFLNGADALGGNKDGRRSRIAAKYCVVAMVGDTLGDFSEKLREIPSVPGRRAAALAPGIGDKWGRGWFLLPNTAYGAALEGSFADVFPEIAADGSED